MKTQQIVVESSTTTVTQSVPFRFSRVETKLSRSFQAGNGAKARCLRWWLAQIPKSQEVLGFILDLEAPGGFPSTVQLRAQQLD